LNELIGIVNCKIASAKLDISIETDKLIPYFFVLIVVFLQKRTIISTKKARNSIFTSSQTRRLQNFV